MSKVTLIHYDIGNLLSVERALIHVGAELSIARTADDIMKAEKLVLPGVGAFSSCRDELEKRNLLAVIRNKVEQGVALLGICVGMQMLFDESHEFGTHAGFGFIKGQVDAIPAMNDQGQPHKIPHIGWSALKPLGGESEFNHPLLKDVIPGEAVYFVHSYTAHPQSEAARLADSFYGGRRISAVAGQGNVFGTQFHPEKSGATGLKILRNFFDYRAG